MKVVIHFGFPKTGSSTLQFGILKELHEADKINLKTWRLYDECEDLNLRPSSRLFNRQKIVDDYLDFEENKLNVLSDESLTAPLRLREQNYGKNIIDPFNFPKVLKEQIEAKYSEVEIEYKCVITIRNQAKLIFSQYVEEYNWKTYKNIDLLFDVENNIDISGYEIYNFSKYIEELYAVFGKENTCVSLFEDWKHDFGKFCEDISAAFDIPKEQIALSLKNNHFNAKKKSLEGVYSKDGVTFVPYLKSHQEDEIISQFYESNKKLVGLIGMEEKLKKYGYII
jgi:hypothetical protein